MRTVVALIVIAAALSACGGGMSGTTTPSQETAVVTPTRIPASVGPTASATHAAPQFSLKNDLPEGHLIFSSGRGSLYSVSGGTVTDFETSYEAAGLTSPHGLYVASYLESPPTTSSFMASGESVVVRDSDGVEITRVDEAVFLDASSWSPDDSMLAYLVIGKTGVGMLDIATGTTHFFAMASANEIRWSPDSSFVVVRTIQGEPDAVLNPRTGELSPADGIVGSPNKGAVSPNGRYLTAYTGGNAPGMGPWRPVVVDRQTGRSCIVEPSTNYAMKMGGQGGPRLTWSPDSGLFAVKDESGPALGGGYARLDIADPSDCSVQTVAKGALSFRWSPDSRSMILSILNDIKDWYPDPGKASLYQWAPDVGLVPLGVSASSADWSPDGSVILAPDGVNGGTLRILDGSDFTERGDATIPQTSDWTWSPSGRYLAMLKRHGLTQSEILVLDLQTAELSEIAEITVSDDYNGTYIVEWGP